MPVFEPTGLTGLDTILSGGLKPASVVLIEGLPGTGKTLLGTEIAMRSASEMNRPTLYLCFETAIDWFEEAFCSVSWHRSDTLSFAEISASEFIDDFHLKESKIEQRIRQDGIKRLVIDSLTPIQLVFQDRSPREYREFLQAVFRKFRKLGLISVVITETNPSRLLGETGAGPEHFLADTVITLRKESQHRGLLRSIEVAKSRGQKVLLGRHSFRIEETGLQFFPRAYSRERFKYNPVATKEKVPFGIAGLEEILGGGVYRGSSTLFVGISGTGKTIAAMHFLSEGLKRGETCLLVSLDDSQEQFVRDAAQLGFKFQGAIDDGRLIVMHESPVEIELDAHFAEVERVVREKKCSRVVIDSVSTYEMILPEECHEFLLALSALFRSVEATSVFCYECPELLGISQISDKLKASAIADNIVLLNYVEISTMLRRALTVPKTRGSKPDQQTREYVIKTGGFTLLDETSIPAAEKVPQLPLSCYYGVLARSPTRHSPIIDEFVAAGKPMPKSKIPKPLKKTAQNTDAN